MQVVVIGAGAVGGYFGGRLAQAGNDVSFLARGKHLVALRERPLHVKSIDCDFEVSVGASDSAETLGIADAVLVAVKAWQVRDAARIIRPLLGADTVVVPLQNGVEAPGQLIEVLGAKHVVGGLCKIIAYVVAPGHVRHVGAEPYLAFGELDPPGRSARLEPLQRAFAAAGVNCEIPADIAAAMWEKFIFIASISGVGAMTRLTIGEMRANRGARVQLGSAIREMVAVGRASGVNLPRDIAERTWRYIESLPTHGTASMQRDIIESRPSELDAQTGAVVRLGRAAGVASRRMKQFTTRCYH